MKKIFLFISIVSLGLVSCDDDRARKTDASEEAGWVQFKEETTSASEGVDQVINIPVSLVSVSNVSGTNVSFTAVDVNGNNNGYLTWDNTMHIDKDQLTGNIKVTVHSDVPLTSKIVIDFTLTDTSNNFEVGLSDGSKQITNRLTVCPNRRDLFLGTYEVIEDEQYQYTSVVTAGTAPNELIVSNLYDTNHNAKTHIFLSTDSYDITFLPVDENFLFTDPDEGPIYLAKSSTGNSTYNPCDLVLDLKAELAFGDGLVNRSPEVNFVLTKQ